MQIDAAVVRPGENGFQIEKVDLDVPRDDEILVRITAVGVCHTDIVAQQGGFGFTLPAVLGHEGAGIVEKVGKSIRGLIPGDRVAISFRSCGHCPNCSTGHPAYCHSMPDLNYTGMRTDGSHAIQHEDKMLVSNFFGQSSFATHALTYARNVVKIPDDIPFEIAAPLGCGIQTGAGSIINVFQCPSESSLLVTGGGAVGLSAVMAGRIQGCSTIIVVEPHALRREAAIDLGATHVINPLGTNNLSDAVRAILPSGVNFALDTTGRPNVLNDIMNALAPRGMLGCVGISAPETAVPGNLLKMMTYGHQIVGIIEGDSDPALFLPILMDHYRAGRLPIDRLVKTYPFAQINEAIADQHMGTCIKVVLTFDQ